MSDSQSMEVSVVTREPISSHVSEPMDTTGKHHLMYLDWTENPLKSIYRQLALILENSLFISYQELQRLFDTKMAFTHSGSHSNQVNLPSEGSHSAPLQAKIFGQTSNAAPRAALGNITNNVKTTNREALKPLKVTQPTSRVQVYKVRPWYQGRLR